MNKNSSKLRKKLNRRTKKKYTHRKIHHKNKNKANIILEQRFKNLNAKTVKALQNKFRKEHLLLKNKNIVNREQIGCSSNRKKYARQQIGCSSKKNMTGGFAFLTDAMHEMQDAGASIYYSASGQTAPPTSDPTHHPNLGNNSTLIS
jgi:hypothetical protein